MALCHVTGIVYLPDGSVAARRNVEFYKLPDTVTADYLGAVVPEVVTVRTSADGEIDVNLITGNYYGFVLSRNGKEKFRFTAVVPELAIADFADLITAADPVEPLPAWLQQAIDARDEARANADRAEDDADRAEAAAEDAVNNAPFVVKDSAEFLDKTDLVAGARYLPKNIGWDISDVGPGDFEIAGKFATVVGDARIVTPDMVGGDIHKAMQVASRLGAILITGEETYTVTQAVAPENLTWISGNTRIHQAGQGSGGIDPLDSVMFPGDNVEIIGTLRLSLSDRSAGAGAYRAHVLMGRWDTGQGPSGFTFDTLILEGGHNNANGFSMAGNANGVRGKRIILAPGNKIGRGFMAHWGNFAQHYLSGGTYQHAPGAGPTTHPYDVRIGEIVGDIEPNTGDFVAIWCVSAGYDIKVGRVSGDANNAGAGPANMVLHTAGDLGLAYADPAIKAAGMWGLDVGSVKGSTKSSGINRIGRALYYNADSTPQSPSDYLVGMRETYGFVDVEGPNSGTFYGLSGDNGRGATKMTKLRTSKYASALTYSNMSTNTFIEEIESLNNFSRGLYLFGSGDTPEDWPTGLEIGKVIVDGTGSGQTTQGQSTAAGINKLRKSRIGHIVIRRLKDSLKPTWSSAAVEIGANMWGFSIDRISVEWEGGAQSIVVSLSAGAAANVSIGDIDCPAGWQPVSGGVSMRTIGRNREYYYAGGTVPSGVTVRIGDRFIAAAAGTGQAWVYIVTTAGVTGSTAVVQPQMPFA